MLWRSHLAHLKNAFQERKEMFQSIFSKKSYNLKIVKSSRFPYFCSSHIPNNYNFRKFEIFKESVKDDRNTKFKDCMSVFNISRNTETQNSKVVWALFSMSWKSEFERFIFFDEKINGSDEWNNNWHDIRKELGHFSKMQRDWRCKQDLCVLTGKTSIPFTIVEMKSVEY